MARSMRQGPLAPPCAQGQTPHPQGAPGDTPAPDTSSCVRTLEAGPGILGRVVTSMSSSAK